MAILHRVCDNTELAKNETLFEYETRLISLGVKRLGEGASGTVWQHPKLSSVAVKIYSSYSSDPSRKWLKWCKETKGNPWLPVVYKMGKLKELHYTDHYVAFMEKLKKATHEEIMRVLMRNNQADRLLILKKDAESLPRLTWVKGLKGTPNEFSVIKDKGLRQALQMVWKLNKREPDMHMDNFMKRGNQLVFTDPVV